MSISTRQHTIVTSHGSLAVEESGQGSLPVLLIHSRRVDQGLNKEIRCRVLDSLRCRQRSCDLMQQKVWPREPWNEIERTTDPIR
jgi:hypothetical protein